METYRARRINWRIQYVLQSRANFDFVKLSHGGAMTLFYLPISECGDKSGATYELAYIQRVYSSVVRILTLSTCHMMTL